jgi:hypothetical protein
MISVILTKQGSFFLPCLIMAMEALMKSERADGRADFLADEA